MRRKFLFTEVLQSIKGRINVRISPSGTPNEGRDQSWPMASHQAHMLRILTLETLYRLTEHFSSNRQTSKILWVWFQTTAINRVMQFLWFPGAHASYVYTILQSIQCAIAVCPKTQCTYLNKKYFIVKKCYPSSEPSTSHSRFAGGEPFFKLMVAD